MALVNCSVVNRTSNKTVLPWSILSAGESGITIQQFYAEKIVCKVHELNEMDLESAFLGKSKESLDKIELSLSLDSAIHLFGPFLRYYTCDRLQQLPPMRNAFTVLMSSQTWPSCSCNCAHKKGQIVQRFLGIAERRKCIISRY